MVFTGRKKVVFVHGCYWHRHGCKKTTTPKTNAEFWQKKFDENIMRDNKNLSDLEKMGWGTMVVWQCETEKPEKVAERLVAFLGSVN